MQFLTHSVTRAIHRHTARTVRMMGVLLCLALVHAAPARADDSLYQALGGQDGIVHITDDFVANLLADPRTSPYFEGVTIKRLKGKLSEEFCVLSGGPCVYTGRPIKRAHEGLKIDRAAFDALVEDLQKSMDKHDIPFHTQNKFLALLAPMYRDVEDHD
jgi:hemoglobin